MIIIVILIVIARQMDLAKNGSLDQLFYYNRHHSEVCSIYLFATVMIPHCCQIVFQNTNTFFICISSLGPGSIVDQLILHIVKKWLII